MANRATPYGTRYTGWYKDDVNTQMKFYLNGTLVLTASGNDLTLADKLTVAGTSLLTGVPTIGGNYALPTADGTVGQQLTTNGTGTVTWSASS